MRFRLIDSGYNAPSMNMAIDEALLTSKLSVLRFYRWKPAGLSLGYFQDIKEININFCKKNNICIVRRITGGKTVLHDNELTYSFIIDEKSMPSSIIEGYKVISKGILTALKKLGINASMKGDIVKNAVKRRQSAICFNEPSYYEIIVNGKKIAGSAQTRKNGKLLQHGAVLIDVDIEKYVNCLNSINKEEVINLSKKRITSLNEFNKKITYEDATQAMKLGFEKNFKVKLIDDRLTEEELKQAKKLEKDKYLTDKWNFRT